MCASPIQLRFHFSPVQLALDRLAIRCISIQVDCHCLAFTPNFSPATCLLSPCAAGAGPGVPRRGSGGAHVPTALGEAPGMKTAAAEHVQALALTDALVGPHSLPSSCPFLPPIPPSPRPPIPKLEVELPSPPQMVCYYGAHYSAFVRLPELGDE